MSRHYVPADGGDGQLAALLAARLDDLETRIDALARDTGTGREADRADIEALGRGLAALTATVRDLPTRGGAGGGEKGEAEEAVPGARDWLTVTDPETAAEWLTSLADWVGSVWPVLDGRPLPGCWPVHPRTVADLLVLHDVYGAAFTHDSPVPAADVFTRWHPEASRRIRTDLTGCTPSAHRLPGSDRHARFDPTALPAVAQWWTTTRADPTGPLPVPPGLTPLD